MAVTGLDITEAGAVHTLLRHERPDLVVHLAGQASANTAGSGGDECWSVNCAGTLNIATQLATNGSPCLFVLASTTDVYGRSFAEGMVTEASAPQPLSPYARSKLAAEMILGDVLPPFVRSIAVRATNHSGAGQDGRFVIPSVATQIVRAKLGKLDDIQVGNLRIERDFLHVDDVVAAYLALIEHTGSWGVRSVFNVASGTLTSIEHLLQRMQSLAGISVPYCGNPLLTRTNDVDRTRIDASLIRSLTGWTPTRTLDQTLDEVLADQWSRVQERASDR